jgi:hypothetical protein
MPETKYDIFAGTPGNFPMWLETVVGLANAKERMEMIAAKKPGQYFLFSVLTQTTVARIEVFKKTSAAD